MLGVILTCRSFLKSSRILKKLIFALKKTEVTVFSSMILIKKAFFKLVQRHYSFDQVTGILYNWDRELYKMSLLFDLKC